MCALANYLQILTAASRVVVFMLGPQISFQRLLLTYPHFLSYGWSLANPIWETKSMTDKPVTNPAIEMVALKQLCTELKVSPREAREKLRLAVRDTKKNPELAKSHKPGQAWEWPKNSLALKEVRAAITA